MTDDARTRTGGPPDAEPPGTMPGPVVSVGVTGHRRLPHADMERLADAVAEILEAIRSAAEVHLGPAPTPVACRLVSSLAAGADTLVAEVALSRGFALRCPLPFQRDAYARDVPDGPERDRFFAALARAEMVHELDGIPGDPDGYLAAGRLVIEQSDVLLAVWDGRPERGVGGTGQIVREARRADLPVIVVEPAAPHRCRAVDSAMPAEPRALARDTVSAAFAASGGP